MNQERIYTTKHDKSTDTRTANIGNVASVLQIVEHEDSFPLLSLKPEQKITRVRGNQADISNCWYRFLLPTSLFFPDPTPRKN
ncbi:hypothetical protein CMK14_19165 [Candidatus Poribacteria bacterium]|nr:hypothetical protein [Candidatus Poribacteria bacterium]